MKETGKSTLKKVNYTLKREIKEYKVNEKLTKMLAIASSAAFVTSVGYIAIYDARLLNPVNRIDGVSLLTAGLITASIYFTGKYITEKMVLKKNIEELKQMKNELEQPRKLDMLKIKKY